MDKKKKVTPVPDEKENNMDALEDTHVYRAGNEADETMDDEEDITEHQNGGIPDGTEDDDDDDEEDDYDEKE
jgi:hypothetical protein